ncbi:MAG: cache domain-containing protein [Arcobacter sp.]|nr:cache domain-containing protein [Arcobacter sp.]
MKSLKSKLLLVTILPFLIGNLILFTVNFFNTDSLLEKNIKKFESSILEEKQSLLKNELTSVKSLVNTILDNTDDIKLAKKEIISLLSGIRYLDNKSGYFFAYEKRNDGYYFGFHGTKARLNGKKTNILKPDIKGFTFRKALIDAKNNWKFVKYYYEKPKTKEIVPKMASSVYIPKLNWTIVTGIYIDDIENEIKLLEDKINEERNKSLIMITIISIILIALTSIVLYPLLNVLLVKPINKFQEGLNDFFKYLNREKEDVYIEPLNRKDELGQMSELLVKNVRQVRKNVQEDRLVHKELLKILGDFQKGDLSQRLEVQVESEALINLKSILNNMAENLEKNINHILDILEEYSNYKYINNVDTNNVTNHLLRLGTSVNTLGSSITSMLIESKDNGNTLLNSSHSLLKNVDILNDSSKQAAKNLEETSDSLKQITTNIRNNAQNIEQMSNLANNVTKSVKDGEELASKTYSSMDDINEQVSLINEAITVIDQIAFQTNILSLNAAVEAATAGEAGKGFAVVAGEVRNLANRSAQAAKEIKDLVENATSKANDGKHIANDMTDGYVKLNENIKQTMDLIKNVENSSKEQLINIEQINESISILDQKTQENAQIASVTKDIASSTDNIASKIIENVNEKEF